MAYNDYRSSSGSRSGGTVSGNRGARENGASSSRPNNYAPVRISIPADYLKDGYIDESGVLDIKLITTQAEQLGKGLGNDGKTGVSKIRKKKKHYPSNTR